MNPPTASPSQPSAQEMDRFLREFARMLAPYMEQELGRPKPSISPAWDEGDVLRTLR